MLLSKKRPSDKDRPPLKKFKSDLFLQNKHLFPQSLSPYLHQIIILSEHPPIPKNNRQSIDFIPFDPLNNRFWEIPSAPSTPQTPSSHTSSRQPAKSSLISNSGSPIRAGRSKFILDLCKICSLYLNSNTLENNAESANKCRGQALYSASVASHQLGFKALIQPISSTPQTQPQYPPKPPFHPTCDERIQG